MKPTLRLAAFCLVLLAIFSASLYLWKNFDTIKPKATLTVETDNTPASITFNDRALGNSPITINNLVEAEGILKIKNDSSTYTTNIKLTANTETVVRHRFAPVESFSDSTVAWYERTDKKPEISITSDTDEISVSVNGDSKGTTPILITNINTGEYSVKLEKDGFEPKTLTVRAADKYRLRLAAALALNPIRSEIQPIDSGNAKISLYRILNDKLANVPKRESVASVSAYWLKSRQGSEPISQITFFLDSEGSFYDKNGKQIDLNQWEPSEKLDQTYVGYLELTNNSLSDKAKANLPTFAAKILKTPPQITKAVIGTTATGWLRVRSGPGLSNSEVTRVNVGEKFPLIEENNGWAKIKLADGKEGWVSGDYITKIQEAP